MLGSRLVVEVGVQSCTQPQGSKMSAHTSALTGKAGELLVAGELLRRSVDVAVPAYDKGIDLLAYREHDLTKMVPIQVKARASTGYNFQRSWFRYKGLVLIHVWRLQETPEFYVFASLDEVEDALGPAHCKSKSWAVDGGYNVTDPGAGAVGRMQPHRDRWDRILKLLPKP
jgi:hypothetical protein